MTGTIIAGLVALSLFGAAGKGSKARCNSCTRAVSGRIARSGRVREQFKRQTGYPKGRPGYVIDHIKPLACGGTDTLDNLQWQTKADAKAKDRTERNGCNGRG